MSLQIHHTIQLDEYYAVYPMDGGPPIWFTRATGADSYYRTASYPCGSSIVSTIDPISAVVRHLVTPDEVKMPAGLAGLLALLRS